MTHDPEGYKYRVAGGRVVLNYHGRRAESPAADGASPLRQTSLFAVSIGGWNSNVTHQTVQR